MAEAVTPRPIGVDLGTGEAEVLQLSYHGRHGRLGHALGHGQVGNAPRPGALKGGQRRRRGQAQFPAVPLYRQPSEGLQCLADAVATCPHRVSIAITI